MSFLFRKRPYLSVVGRATMADGIGRQAIDLINLFVDDLSIGFIPTAPPTLVDIPPKIMPVIKRPNRRLGKVVVYEATFPAAENLEDWFKKWVGSSGRQDLIRIAYTMVESTKLSYRIVEAINTYFDAVAVPDPFLVEIYRSSVKKPVFCLPLGIDLEPMLKQPLKASRNKPFCFINPSTLTLRKNPLGLIKAFHAAFGDDPAVQLHMNYRYSGPDALKLTNALLEKLNCQNISLTNYALDQEFYLQFLLKGDVFVSLALGEGFSIQPREAMALGLPVIVSNNTAHQTIVKSGLVAEIPCTPRPCYVEYQNDVWELHVPDFEASVQALRSVYENYEQSLEKAAERREWAAQYQMERLKPLYASLINPAKVSLGEVDSITPEGLTTTSEALYAKYKSI